MSPRTTNGVRAAASSVSSSRPSSCSSTTGRSASTGAGAASAMAEPPILALDQRREVGERCQGHEYRHEISGRMKLGQGAGFERPQPLLVDQMIADQSVLRAVMKLNVEREGLEQIVPLERR